MERLDVLLAIALIGGAVVSGTKIALVISDQADLEKAGTYIQRQKGGSGD